MEITPHDPNVIQVAGLSPDGNRLGWKASVGEGHDGSPPWLENPVCFSEYLQGLGQVVDRDAVGDDVKGIVGVGQDRVDVEVLDGALGELGVAFQLLLDHPQSDDSSGGVALGVVAHPAGAEVKEGHVLVARGGKDL